MAEAVGIATSFSLDTPSSGKPLEVLGSSWDERERRRGMLYD